MQHLRQKLDKQSLLDNVLISVSFDWTRTFLISIPFDWTRAATRKHGGAKII